MIVIIVIILIVDLFSQHSTYKRVSHGKSHVLVVENVIQTLELMSHAPFCVVCDGSKYPYSSSLLSIVSDDDISVGYRPLRALLVGERIVQFVISSLSRS